MKKKLLIGGIGIVIGLLIGLAYGHIQLGSAEKELKQLTVDSQRKYDQCAEHNAGLYGIADDLIHRYERKGVMGSLLEKEPFTQIKKVELEKLVQDYKDRIDREKLRSK